MKRLRLGLFACLIFTVAHGQTPPTTKTVAAPSDAQSGEAQLQLATTVLSSCYIKPYPSTLRWTLLLTYTNVGRQPVLVDKNSSTIYRSLVSRSLKDAEAKKYEYDSSLSFIDPRGAGVRTEATPEENAFVALKPGESYSLQNVHQVYLSDGTEDTEDYLRPGNHFLQLRVMTWYYLESPETYRERWRDKGYLWSQNITSLPMQFTVEKRSNVAPCS